MGDSDDRPPGEVLHSILNDVECAMALGLEQIYRQLERPAEAPTTTTTKSTPPEQRPTSSKPTATRVPEAQPLSAQDATDVKRTARIPTVDASSTSPSARLQRIVKVLAEKEVEYNAEMAKALAQKENAKKIDEAEEKANALRERVRALHAGLRHAERVLADALYDSQQKRASIRRAETANLSVEEIVRYAHHISINHSVAAPFNWEAGDPRRPYPSDVDMRAGALGHADAAPPPPIHFPSDAGGTLSFNSTNFLAQHSLPFAWQVKKNAASGASAAAAAAAVASQPIHVQVHKAAGSGGAMGNDPASGSGTGGAIPNADDEVETMSTDSSSNSSSDSNL